MQKLCKTPAREVRHFRDFPKLSSPSKQAQERSKRSRNDWVTANFDEFHKISYISVIFGPKIMLLGSCDGHGYWSHVHPCSSMVTWSCWQQHNVGASSRWFCGDKLIMLLVAWSPDHAPGSMVTWSCSWQHGNTLLPCCRLVSATRIELCSLEKSISVQIGNVIIPLSLQIDSFITLDLLNFGRSTHDEFGCHSLWFSTIRTVGLYSDWKMARMMILDVFELRQAFLQCI